MAPHTHRTMYRKGSAVLQRIRATVHLLTDTCRLDRDIAQIQSLRGSRYIQRHWKIDFMHHFKWMNHIINAMSKEENLIGANAVYTYVAWAGTMTCICHKIIFQSE